MRPLFLTLHENFFTTVARLVSLASPLWSWAPKTCSIIRRTSRSCYPSIAQDTVRRMSAKVSAARDEPLGEAPDGDDRPPLRSGRAACDRLAMAQPLPAGRRLAPDVRVRPPSTRCSTTPLAKYASRPAPTSSARSLTLRRDRHASSIARPPGLQTARRQEGHQGRALPAELPDLHRLLLRHAQGRRHGRQLQPPLHARGARPSRSRTARPS